MKNEVWKDVFGYEGFYQVSNYGRIRSVNRIVKTARGKRLACGKIKAPRKSSNGYLNITLSKNGIKEVFMVHRIVAGAFIANEEKLPIVNHINGNRTDNRAKNLEWCSLLHNYVHAATRLGSNCGVKPILCEETKTTFFSIHEAARVLGKTPSAVWNVVNGKRKTVGGYHLRYADTK